MSLQQEGPGALERRIASQHVMLTKHSVVVGGHKTSISLEPAFWAAIKSAAKARKIKIGALVEEIEHAKPAGNLSSACRLYVLDLLQKELAQQKGPATS